MEQTNLYPTAPPKGKLQTVRLDEIQPIAAKPPRSLVRHIGLHGVLNPVVLADMGDAGYRIVEGRRRVAALREMGAETVPANVLDADDVDHYSAALSVALNEERSGNPVSNFDSVVQLANAGHGVGQIARACSLTVPTVAALLKLTLVHPRILDWMHKGLVKHSVVRLISRTSRATQDALVERFAPIFTSGQYSTSLITAREVKEFCPEFAGQGGQTVLPEVWASGALEALDLIESTAPGGAPMAWLDEARLSVNQYREEVKA